jgi:hypothetical protein
VSVCGPHNVLCLCLCSACDLLRPVVRIVNPVILIDLKFHVFIGGRRCSTRDFFSDINTAILQMETMVESEDTWALTLATAVQDQALCLDMDVVFVGHMDG